MSMTVKKTYWGAVTTYENFDGRIVINNYRDSVTVDVNNQRITIPLNEFYRMARLFLQNYMPTNEDITVFKEDDKKLKTPKTPLETRGYREVQKELVNGVAKVEVQATPEFFRK